MINKHNRSCIICESKKYEILNEEELEITGLESIRIGISICTKCGCVFQNPCVPRDIMLNHYEKFSNYTNAGTKFKPSDERIRLISKQVKFCLDNIPNEYGKKRKLFQIGCSDGYTLSVFKDKGWDVTGIDPSDTCKELAKKNHDIYIHTGFFEEFQDKKKFDLVVLTHVLEHLYEPKKILLKIRENLNKNGNLFLEVPYLGFPHLWPNGFFSFEHIQFFSEKNLKRLLENCGYEILSKRYFFHQYPIISFVCRKTVIPYEQKITNEFSDVKNDVINFLNREKITWKNIKEKIKIELKNKKSVYIWGAGIHTSKLLYWTNINNEFKINNIIDNDPQKQELFLSDIKIINPKNVKFSNGDAIIISSHVSENQIYKSIKNLENLGIKIIKLYT